MILLVRALVARSWRRARTIRAIAPSNGYHRRGHPTRARFSHDFAEGLTDASITDARHHLAAHHPRARRLFVARAATYGIVEHASDGRRGVGQRAHGVRRGVALRCARA